MNHILSATERANKIKARAKHLRLVTLSATMPHIRHTREEDFVITRRTASDGYVTWEIRYTGQYRAAAGLAVVTSLKEAREAIIAHRESGGETWYPHLVQPSKSW